MENQEVYTIPQLTDMLHTDRKQLMQLIYSGQLEAFRLGKRWRVTRQALATYIAAHTYQPINA